MGIAGVLNDFILHVDIAISTGCMTGMVDNSVQVRRRHEVSEARPDVLREGLRDGTEVRRIL